ncbi:sulfur carrier protein ThiS [Mesoterricola silvestris]|uniref:Thiamine biosynthesis protein ThiS n=1 Tax=Mesoterricola silvestris TaxID=2927979 RepID=A0AA48GJM3_9BACT|nr:sulfur carrier protein ThiS [Mesoterricola silvestris]BDU70934.1 thiamine biosynthesis protein ThiS [Mesoterricola silvestris]
MITVNGDPVAWTPGMTVRDVLAERNFKFPLLVIKIDSTLVQPRDYPTTPVPDGAVVQVIHLMSGG